MWFVMLATANAEQYGDLFHVVEKMKIPVGIKVHQILEIFGKPDVIMVFEAKNEKIASEFVRQFGRVSEVTTHLAIKVR